MPRIQTNLADAPLRIGPVSPEADPLAFNRNAGLTRLGEGIADVGQAASAIAQKRQTDDEYRWLVSASHRYSVEAATFENDEANNSREDFAQHTLDTLEKRKADFLAEAPSKRSAARLQAQLDTVIEQRYQRALQVGDRTKLENASRDLDRNVADAMAAYRADAGNSQLYAKGTLQPLIALTRESIVARFGKLAPNIAHKLLEHVDSQFVIGVAQSDPSYARELLDESRVIDEKTRATLLNHIEAQETSASKLQREQFSYDLEQSMKRAARERVAMPKITLQSFEAVFGKTDGVIIKARADRQADEITQASIFLSKVEGLNPSTLAKEFAGLSSANTPDAVVDSVGPEVKAMTRMALSDPYEYQSQYDDDVRKANAYAEQAPAGEARFAARARAKRVALELQGYPPIGTPPSEQSKYLHLPDNARHVMGKSEAMATVATFSKGGAEQQIEALTRLVLEYPDDLQAIAYNDLVNLPPDGKRIAPIVQWGFLHHNKDWVRQLLAAQNDKDVLALKTEAAGEFEREVNEDENWERFRQTLLIDDDTRRVGEIAGFKEGLLNYAMYLSVKGKIKAGPAVELASERLIGSAFGFPVVNGIPVMMMRARRDGSVYSRDEIQDVARKLNIALETIPAMAVKKTDPYGRDLFTLFPEVVGKAPLERSLSNILRRHAFFVTRPDGYGASVYLSGEDQVAFQLLDTNNQPWEIEFDNLPFFGFAHPSGREYPSSPHKSGMDVRQGWEWWKNIKDKSYKVGPGMQPTPH